MDSRIRENYRYLALEQSDEILINLAGSYDYLELPYYVSQSLENMGQRVLPTCKEMLDAYITPLFLEKARLAGLTIPEYYISNGYFEPPVIIDPINPFMIKSRTVRHTPRRQTISRSMTRNFTYAICCQDIPENAHIMNPYNRRGI